MQAATEASSTTIHALAKLHMNGKATVRSCLKPLLLIYMIFKFKFKFN